MPVEFLCPHCRTKMRTADDAMRREIGCPKCRGRLRVPVVKIPEPVAVTVVEESPGDVGQHLADSSGASSSEDGPFDFTGSDGAGSSGERNVSGAADGGSKRTAKYRASKRGKRRNSLWPMLGVMALLTVLIVAAVQFAGRGPDGLVGTLIATEASGPVTGTLELPDSEAKTALLDALSDEPITLRSAVGSVEFGAAGGRLSLTADTSQAGRLIAVDPKADPQLAAYLAENAAALAAERARRLDEEASKFVDDMAGSGSVETGVAPLYRDSVALAAMQRGLGMFVVAEADVALPCVTEEADGTLLFLVPDDADRLTLVRRAVKGNPLPDLFRYQITLP